MTSVEEHARTIERMLAGPLGLAGTGTGIGAEAVPLSDALGRVTAIDVSAAVDLPVFRNSQMDGFAARATDLVGAPVTLPVAGDIPAGRAQPPALSPGTVIRIMTGAIVPEGADCVVPVEDTRLDDTPLDDTPLEGTPRDDTQHDNTQRDDTQRDDTQNGTDAGSVRTRAGASVTITAPRIAGDFVRERGSDLRRGELLLPAGQRLAPRHLAALAAGGLDSVLVRRRVRVAVITTGAELAPVGAALASGQIFDANLVALSAAVTEAGAELVLAESSSDDTGAFLGILARATREADLVVTSGGVSQGAYEVVRDALEPLGAVVGHVDMQPGGPQATAVVDGVPVICFPGNPVSTQVSFVVFLRPILRRAAGLTALPPTARRLARPVASVAGKRQFLRGRIRDDGTVETVAGAGSHLVAAMARADVLLDIPPEITDLAAGQNVGAWEL
jgi:molybdopterin molybdotransferase